MNVVDWLWISDQEIKEGTELLNILPTQLGLLRIQPEANLMLIIYKRCAIFNLIFSSMEKQFLLDILITYHATFARREKQNFLTSNGRNFYPSASHDFNLCLNFCTYSRFYSKNSKIKLI